MPLGTLDRRPPPLFHQGPSALTRLMGFSAVALFLMAADTRFAVTRPLRSALSILLLPLERALEMPLQALHSSGEYVGGLHQAQAALAQSQGRLPARVAKGGRA